MLLVRYVFLIFYFWKKEIFIFIYIAFLICVFAVMYQIITN